VEKGKQGQTVWQKQLRDD